MARQRKVKVDKMDFLKGDTYTTTQKVKEDGKIVEKTITYQTNPSFKPSTIEEISIPFMIKFCLEKEDSQWLSDELNKEEEIHHYRKVPVLDSNGQPIINKKSGKPRMKKTNIIEKTVKVPQPFVKVRSAFAEKYFPKILIGNDSQTWGDIAEFIATNGNK